MLKKLGVVTVGVTAGLLTAAGLASADETDATPTATATPLLGSTAEPTDTTPADTTPAATSEATDQDTADETDGTGAGQTPDVSPVLQDVMGSETSSTDRTGSEAGRVASDRGDDSFQGNKANISVLGQRLPIG